MRIGRPKIRVANPTPATYSLWGRRSSISALGVLSRGNHFWKVINGALFFSPSESGTQLYLRIYFVVRFYLAPATTQLHWWESSAFMRSDVLDAFVDALKASSDTIWALLNCAGHLMSVCSTRCSTLSNFYWVIYCGSTKASSTFQQIYLKMENLCCAWTFC